MTLYCMVKGCSAPAIIEAEVELNEYWDPFIRFAEVARRRVVRVCDRHGRLVKGKATSWWSVMPTRQHLEDWQK